MAFTLEALPYGLEALEPHLSARTLDFHRNKHQQGYLNTLNTLTEGTSLQQETLEDLIPKAFKDPAQKAIFNNAAQVWNHSFYWNSLKPGGGGDPADGPLKKALLQKFGSIGTFGDLFKKAALGQFGSGWAWLVLSSTGDLEIVTTSNAELPLLQGQKALLTCDVWEHAYYLDYQNRRVDYAQIFLDHLINWSFVEENFLAGGGR